MVRRSKHFGVEILSIIADDFILTEEVSRMSALLCGS